MIYANIHNARDIKVTKRWVPSERGGFWSKTISWNDGDLDSQFTFIGTADPASVEFAEEDKPAVVPSRRETMEPGTKVNVINTTMSGTYFVEGYATVIKPIRDDVHLVDFGDGMQVERFIDPQVIGKCGAEVARYVGDLNAGAIEPPDPESQTRADPLHGERMDSADMGEC